MSLKQACQNYLRSSALPIKIPAESATGQKSKQLSVILQRPATHFAPAEDIEAVLRRINVQLLDGTDLSISDLRQSPWGIWTGNEPLCASQGKLELLLEQMTKANDRRVYRALATVFLYGFEVDRSLIKFVASFLKKNINKLGEPWLKANNSLQLFSVEQSPNIVARLALENKKTPDDILVDFGLVDTNWFIGFREAAFEAGFLQLAQSGAESPLARLEMIKLWIYDGDKVRMDSLKIAAVNAAILPFRGQKPSKDLRDVFLSFVLPLLNDPRIAGGNWSRCQSAEQIVRIWLTEQSLRQFFDVVGRVAPPEHWDYRSRFWWALHQRGYVDEAWVVFEADGAAMARRLFGKDLTFGRFSQTQGVQKGHSVLILKLGSLIVTEWSHSSPCSIWDELQGPNGPKLYSQKYDPNDLKKSFYGGQATENMTRQGVFYHRSSTTYFWQKEIANHLRSKRQILIKQSEYEVRS